MPTYEYHCDSCDRNFDVVQSFTDEPLTECPTCGSPVRKVFGNVGIVFKGSGFYKTDSRSGSTKKAAAGDSTSSDSGSDSSAPSTGGGGDTAGGDSSKPATPSPSSPSTPAKSGGDTKSGASSNSAP